MEPLIPYHTVLTESETEAVVNRSRFIGRCCPVETEAAAREALARIRKRYWDASHHCFGYVLGVRGDSARFSDDGEPGGTAGMPIMEVLKSRGVTNALCVVTRYFGGVLLGAGGLARAYSRSAADALNAAGVALMLPGIEILVEIDYARYGAVEALLRGAGEVNGVSFTDRVTASITVEAGAAEGLCADVTDKTDGRAVIRRGEWRYMKKAVNSTP